MEKTAISLKLSQFRDFGCVYVPTPVRFLQLRRPPDLQLYKNVMLRPFAIQH